MQISQNLQQQVQEFIDCKGKPRKFIRNHVKIEIPGKTLPLPMYNKQEEFLDMLLGHHHVISLKSRQTGISTVTQAYITYVFTFFKNVVVGVVSKDQQEATDFSRKVQSMIDNLPAWSRPKYVKKTEQSFILNNGCQLYAQTINPRNPGKLFRGKSVTIAVMDEAAHAENIEEAWTGFGPALVKNQSLAKQNGVPYATIVISTPNKTMGVGKWYYELWKDSQSLDSIYRPIVVYWRDIPEFANDPNWYRDQCRVLMNKKSLIEQELELKFISSEKSFFPSEVIDTLNNVSQEVIKTVKMKNGKLLIWEHPDLQKFYLIGVDTASSHGGDKSTVEVIDYETMNQVAEFRSKLRIDDFSEVVASIARLFKNNLIVPENNSYGESIAEYLTKDDRFFEFNVYAPKHSYGDNKQTVYGLTNTSKTRPLMIDALYNYIVEDPKVVKSKYLALELIGLEENARGKVEASKGEHDDLALAYAFCCYVRMYDPTARRKMAISSPNISLGTDSIVSMNDEEITYNIELGKIKSAQDNNPNLSKQQRENFLRQKNMALKKLIKKQEDVEIDLEDLIYDKTDLEEELFDFSGVELF